MGADDDDEEFACLRASLSCLRRFLLEMRLNFNDGCCCFGIVLVVSVHNNDAVLFVLFCWLAMFCSCSNVEEVSEFFWDEPSESDAVAVDAPFCSSLKEFWRDAGCRLGSLLTEHVVIVVVSGKELLLSRRRRKECCGVVRIAAVAAVDDDGRSSVLRSLISGATNDDVIELAVLVELIRRMLLSLSSWIDVEGSISSSAPKTSSQ